MTKRESATKVAGPMAAAAGPDEGPEAGRRQFAEEFGVLGESMGSPRMNGRVLGWLLICDPPRQSIAGMARALGVSRASISIATRLLQAGGLIRRVAEPGRRGYVFELDPEVFTRLPTGAIFGALRRQLDRGIAIVGDEDDPRAARVRAWRDFYAYVEREMPALIARYRTERAATPGRSRP